MTRAFAGPNACSPQVPCNLQYDLCGSGLVKPGTGHVWACRSDRPGGAVVNVRPLKELRVPARGVGCFFLPGGSPSSSHPPTPPSQGFGGWCYDSLQRCTVGAAPPYPPPSPPLPDFALWQPSAPPGTPFPLPSSRSPAGNNPCNENAPCILAQSYCSTGVAGDYAGAYNYFCNTSAPPVEVATPNGAGQLCYATIESCMAGGNACDESYPCGAHPSTCFTGVVRPFPSPRHIRHKPSGRANRDGAKVPL